MKPSYAGVGARATPTHILSVMRGIGRVLAKDGYICQTGAAQGADQAFADGALCGGGEVILCLPWPTYEREWVDNLVGSVSIRVLADAKTVAFNKPKHTLDRLAYLSVNELHPTFGTLSQGARKLHARNFLIMQEIKFMLCWTPDGIEAGGTGQAIRIAKQTGINIHNLGDPNVLKHFVDKLTEVGEM